MYENGTYHDACDCRWLSENSVSCKIQRIVSICEMDSFEMRLSLFVKRTYSDILWKLYRNSTKSFVFRNTKLRVTCKHVFQFLIFYVFSKMRKLPYNENNTERLNNIFKCTCDTNLISTVLCFHVFSFLVLWVISRYIFICKLYELFCKRELEIVTEYVFFPLLLIEENKAALKGISIDNVI